MKDEVYLTKISTKRLLALSTLKNYRDSAIARHRLVMSLFPKDLGESPRSAGDILFRVERTPREGFVLIQSSIAPVNLPGVEMLKRPVVFTENSFVRFRVTLSPVVRTGGKERSLTTQDELELYLEKKLAPAATEITVVNLKQESIRRNQRGQEFLTLAQFDGLAKISNQDAFKELIISGIGRNKNYGAGLLTAQEL